PILTLSTQGLSFTGLVNGSPPPAQSVTLANTGAGTMEALGAVTIGTVTYGPGAANWVTVPQSGSAVIGGTFSVRVTPGGTPPGSYTATVPVTSQNGGGQSVTVTLSVVRETDPPKLVLSANTLRFGALVGGSNPEPQAVLASNAGGGTLGQIQLGPTAYGPGGTGWLNPAFAGEVIAVSAISGGLEKGSYTATVPVASPQGGSETLAVTLEVGSPRLTVSPRTVSFGDTVGGSGPLPGKVILANTGGGTFSSLGEISLGGTLYGEGGSGWLSASLSENSLSLTARPGELEARAQAYSALLPVLSPFGGSDTVTVVFTVTPGASPPRLALSVDSLSFDAIVGGADPSAQNVSAFNGGGGTLGAVRIREITYLDAPEGWLEGSVDGMTLQFMPFIEGLPGGGHRAAVVVESEEGGEARVEARLNLAQPVLSLSSGSVTFSDTLSSPDTLRSKVFLSNIGGGDRSSLGILRVLPINYTEGESGWLDTDPIPGATVSSNLVELKAHGGSLPEGTSVAVVRIESQWGGVETVEVTFSARKPDRSFDLPTIELVQQATGGGSGVLVPLPGDSVVATAQPGTTAQIGLRVGVRNGSETRVILSGLRVGVPTYREGQQKGWIIGAFLNRTTATFSNPAELSITVSPGGLPAGRYEASLVVSSGNAGLESVEPRTLRILLVVG
ncbi:MAG: hypothetical protein MUO50_06540, partial [Longimicrobiales bacterium]|nr:hypothetical protein [Longimicrobiales bacterium]